MSFDSLLIHTVRVFNPTDTDSDRYGNVELVYDDGVEVRGRVQEESSNEVLLNRDTRVTMYRLFVRPSVSLTALSLVQWQGAMYRVDGEPTVENDGVGPHHLEAILQGVDG